MTRVDRVESYVKEHKGEIISADDVSLDLNIGLKQAQTTLWYIWNGYTSDRFATVVSKTLLVKIGNGGVYAVRDRCGAPQVFTTPLRWKNGRKTFA